MPLPRGFEQGKRRWESIYWTCTEDCWCHIPVGDDGVQPPPCYQCVLVTCSLSRREDFTPSAPEFPADDYTLDQASAERSQPDRSSHFNTDDNTLGATVLPLPLPSVRSKIGTTHGIIPSPLLESNESFPQNSVNPIASSLKGDDYTTDQFLMYHNNAGPELPEEYTLSNNAQHEESTAPDLDNVELENESVPPMINTQVNINSWIDTEENRAPFESTQDPEDSGDLSSRLRMLILGSEGQESMGTQRKEAANSRKVTNFMVNTKGLTVCNKCGDAHLCHSKRRTLNHNIRKHHQPQTTPVPHRPRISTSVESRNRALHPHSTQVNHRPRQSMNPSSHPHCAQISHRTRQTISLESRNRSFHPHGHLADRELEFRNVNRIHRRESATEAATRFLHSGRQEHDK